MNAKAFIVPVLLGAAIPAYHYYTQPTLPAATALPPESARVREIISLNDAGPEDLVVVRGIGTAFAGRILAARPPGGFRSWDEVAAVKGVGPARLALLREHFVLP